jgi:hypothetical protein
VLETIGRTWAAQRTSGATAISNRVTLRSDWTRASADVAPGTDFDAWRHPTMWTGHADVRLRSTLAAARGASGPADVVAGLRDHGTGPWGAPRSGAEGVEPPPAGPGFDPGSGEGVSVCMHLRAFQATTASIVASLETDRSREEPLRYWAALGNPCASVYVPGFLLADHPGIGAPATFGDPATAARFAALSRSVEDLGAAGPARLQAVRASLAPLETALWEEADDLASSGHHADPESVAAFEAAAWHRVDAALTTLRA